MPDRNPQFISKANIQVLIANIPYVHQTTKIPKLGYSYRKLLSMAIFIRQAGALVCNIFNDHAQWVELAQAGC